MKPVSFTIAEATRCPRIKHNISETISDNILGRVAVRASNMVKVSSIKKLISAPAIREAA